MCVCVGGCVGDKESLYVFIGFKCDYQVRLIDMVRPHTNFTWFQVPFHCPGVDLGQIF